MPPTYEELVEINKLHQNQIKELQKENKSLRSAVTKLQKENKKLQGQLGKFLNEFTPSGSVPSYLKDELESAFPPENANTEKQKKGKKGYQFKIFP